MNYGGIGMVMGHELTHGFDDQGRKFDAQGKLTEWWEPSVATKFEERAACVEKQYEGYEVQPGLNLNGKLTLGENIADIGGIKEAYNAYKLYEAKHPGIGEAGRSRPDERPAPLRRVRADLVLARDPRDRARARDRRSALAAALPGQRPAWSNYDQFAKTFQCAEGTPMNPKDRCEVW